MDQADVPLPVRVELAHAEIQALAGVHRIDAVLVKGYAADRRLYLPGRISSDVDVLVRPHHAERMVAALRSHGWETVSTFRSGSIFRHAQTMRHPRWGLVDVHRSFPGFELPPEEFFDRVWRDRSTRHIAGYPCTVPCLLDHALIILVHAARSPETLEQDVGHLATVLGTEDWEALERRARELSASVAYAAATGNLPVYRDRPTHDLWLVLSSRGTRSQEWRARLRAAATPAAKLAVVLRAPLPNVDHLRMDLDREPTAVDIARATVRRPVKALRELLTGRAALPGTADAPPARHPPATDSTTHAPSPPHERPDAAGTPSETGHRADAAHPSGGPARPDGDRPAVLRDPCGAPRGTDGPERTGTAASFHRAADVAVVEMARDPGTAGGEGVCVARVPGGRPMVLNDSAALIWHAASSVPEDRVPAAVAAATGERTQDIEAQVLEFVSHLVEQGFLVRLHEP